MKVKLTYPLLYPLSIGQLIPGTLTGRECHYLPSRGIFGFWSSTPTVSTRNLSRLTLVIFCNLLEFRLNV